MLDDAFARLNSAASHAATSQHNQRPGPTPAQAVAGNYLKGRVRIHGLPIAVENDRNSIRTGESADGKAWANRLAAIYGEIEGTVGADGDRIDVFIGHFPETRSVWIINQGWPDGAFDEHKVMLGFQNEEAARDAYLMSFERGWTGLQSIHALSVDQLKWWLRHGDTKKRFAPANLPLFDGATTMNPTPWNADAQPANATLQQVLYGIRVEDRDNLMLDAVSLADIYADPDVARQPQPVLDALVVEVNRLTRKMDVLQGAMDSAGGTLKVPSYEISDPVKLRGTMQVAVLFQLSDGQTVTVWFHNPDTTPAKLMPLDELISWKWLLNKKDITIVVAPERGKDLNVREVARRIMKLAERNAEAFKRANAKLAERVEAEFRLDGEIVMLEKTLQGLHTQIEVAKERKADAARDAAKPMSQVERDAFLTSEEGYATISDDEALLLENQDLLDSFFQGRYVAVRNELRKLGWEGEHFGDLSKEGVTLEPHFKQMGAGRNIVGMHYTLSGVTGFFMSDPLSRSPEELALGIDMGLPHPVAEAAPVVEPVAEAPAVEEPAADPLPEPLTPENTPAPIEPAKGDISYRADDMFTTFLPDTAAGEDAWRVINATEGSEGGKVFNQHADSVIAQLRAAGFVVSEAAPLTDIDDDALAAALTEPEEEAQEAAPSKPEPPVSSPASEAMKAVALRDWPNIDRTDGDGYIGAVVKKTGVPVALVDGTLNRPTYKAIIAEAKDRGMSTEKVTVFCHLATYSGRGIDVVQYVDVAGFNAAGQIDAPAEPEVKPTLDQNLAALVDAAYVFDNATEAFKVEVSGSIEEAEYSPFASAKAIDQSAKANGLKVQWSVGSAVLDSVEALAPVADIEWPRSWLAGESLVKVGAAEPVLDAAATNDPINRAEGATDQADLEARNAIIFTRAISVLQGASILDAVIDDANTAAEWLKKAIALHEKHMKGEAPTTGKKGEISQQLMMNQMRRALNALTGGGGEMVMDAVWNEDDHPRNKKTGEFIEYLRGASDATAAVDKGDGEAAYKAAMSASARAGGVSPRDKNFAGKHDAAMMANEIVLDAHKRGKIKLSGKQVKDLRLNAQDHNGLMQANKKMVGVLDDANSAEQFRAALEVLRAVPVLDGATKPEGEAADKKPAAEESSTDEPKTEGEDKDDPKDESPAKEKKPDDAEDTEAKGESTEEEKPEPKPDSVSDEEADALLDSATDGMIIGKIKRGATIIGRALIGGDGKAMIYVGKSGTDRVQFKSSIDGEKRPAMWSDDDAGLMVEWLIQTIEPETDYAAEWMRMTDSDRGAMAFKAGFGGEGTGLNAKGDRIVRTGWANMGELWRRKLIAAWNGDFAKPPASDVTPAVVALEIARETLATNEPINRAEGDTAQADLEASNIAGIDAALDILANEAAETQPEPVVEPTAIAPIVPTAPSKIEWEEAVFFAMSEQGDMSTSDAQGIADVQGAMLTQQYDAGATPEAAAAAVLAASLAPEPEPVAAAPVPDAAETDVHLNYIRIAADSLAELRKTDVDRVLGSVAADNIDGVTRASLAAWITAGRPDLAAEVAEVMAELAPPVAEPAPAAVDSTADRAYLESLIDGTGDVFAPDVFDRLEPMFAKYDTVPDMKAVLEQAVEVYSAAATKAAQSALATPA